MGSILLHNAALISSTNKRFVDVLIRDGRIERLAYQDLPGYTPLTSDVPVDETIDASQLLLFPGLIDCHVHFREPGLTHKATMQSEARSARAGGVTTVCEMPNTIPPTYTVAALADKVRRAAEIDDCDIHFFFGVTEEAHLHALRELWTGTSDELRRLKKRCCGVKLFLDHSTGNQKVQEEILSDVFRVCGQLGIPVVCHCEDPAMNEAAAASNRRTDVAAHSLMRPPESEARSIEMAIGLARTQGTKLHVAHLSTAQGVDLVRKAKKEGLSVTCEVTPHHLFLTVDDYATLGTFAKMNPPLRTAEHQAALWDGIADGTVDCISTDHAPHTLEEKRAKNPLEAPSGLPGVETMLPLLFAVAAGQWPRGNPKHEIRNPKFQVIDIVRLCFENPNRIFGLGRQGVVEGAPADLVLVDPNAEWTVRASQLHSHCGWTPFEGWDVRGAVVRVITGPGR